MISYLVDNWYKFFVVCCGIAVIFCVINPALSDFTNFIRTLIREATNKGSRKERANSLFVILWFIFSLVVVVLTHLPSVLMQAIANDNPSVHKEIILSCLIGLFIIILFSGIWIEKDKSEPIWSKVRDILSKEKENKTY